jgi:pimeloyl-ACP methyl ester carboxylesterase
VNEESLAALRARSPNPLHRWGIRPLPVDPEDHLGSGRLVPIADGRVHVDSLGQGPDILALPGFAGTSRTWRAVAERLQNRYRLHRCDFLGYGLSDKPAGIDHSRIGQARQIEQVLDALGLKSCILMCNSASAAPALYAQFRTPRRFSAGIMVAPFVAPRRHTAFGLRLLRLPFARPVLKLLLGFRPMIVLANHTGRSDPSGITPEIVDEQYLPYGTPGIWESIAAVGRHLSPAGLNGIVQMNKIPTLVVWASEDRAGDLAGTQRLLGGLADVRFEVFDPCGHVIQEERPDDLTRVVAEFLAEI